ncbi:MAG: hypothetical protein H7A45_21755 [Verrucomicrobiales bacterium]|nr:hypothetical protein [Verrucomicrobiales bacterium]MCP5519874.1 hypothetical protein [Verrucomicrobiales bacterium]MCP5526809.1 hypothetical protein [Verrucomicrobiales bacterium]
MSTGEILEMLPKLEPAERREILERLCALEEADSTGTHQRWIDEALARGTARAADAQDWEDALERGLQRGKQS